MEKKKEEKLNFVFIKHEGGESISKKVKSTKAFAINYGYTFLIIGKDGVVYTKDKYTFNRVIKCYKASKREILETITL